MKNMASDLTCIKAGRAPMRSLGDHGSPIEGH
jgi:hypothetical protein